LAAAALLAAAAVLGTRLRAPATATAPASAEPAGQTPGGIEVATEPPGAEVRIDGSSMGRTPITLSGLEPGSHTVTVSLRGYSSAELSLLVPPGPMPVPLRFTLLPLEARLQVTSVPAGAAVSVDGKAAGSTPLASLAVPPGIRKVEVRQKGFRRWGQAVEARAGDTVPLLAHLEPESDPKDLRAALKLVGWVHEGDLVELGPGVVPPRRVSGAAPAYPEAARKLRLQGTVVVEMIVTERGEPIDLRVVESAGEVLDSTVLAAVRTWRYAPAEKDGVKVRVRQRVREQFSFAG
ncbi:MAG TPA: TonB family protein, partial [Vicinamibacteria bacterium]|nr:TonB family protein [Vicinamibacteria bacterium]